MNKKRYKKNKIASNLSGKIKDNRGGAIVETATKKLHENSGETIVEALVSLIIAVISIAMLVTSVTAASKINEKSKARTSEQLSFEYVELAADKEGATINQNATVKIDFGTTDSSLTENNVGVTAYTTKNGYIYYRKN